MKGSRVFIRKYGSEDKWMPVTITEKNGNSLYEVKAGENDYRRHN